MTYLHDGNKSKHVEDMHKNRLLNLLSNSVLKKDGIDQLFEEYLVTDQSDKEENLLSDNPVIAKLERKDKEEDDEVTKIKKKIKQFKFKRKFLQSEEKTKYNSI